MKPFVSEEAVTLEYIFLMDAHRVCLWTQSCSTLCDPVDCSPPGSSDHRNSQAKILEWVSISSSRGSSPPRDWTQVSCVAGAFFATEPWGSSGCTQYAKMQRRCASEPRQLGAEMLSTVPGHCHSAPGAHGLCNGSLKTSTTRYFHFSPFFVRVKTLFGFLLVSKNEYYVSLS